MRRTVAILASPKWKVSENGSYLSLGGKRECIKNHSLPSENAQGRPLSDLHGARVISMMEWIDDSVAVGGRLDALLVGRLRANSIDLMIDARVFFDKDYGDKKPLLDKMMRAVDALILLTERQEKVLVRCNRGRDRSPFMVMIYISKKYGKSYREAYELVKEKRPRTVYHWDWVEMLQKK